MVDAAVIFQFLLWLVVKRGGEVGRGGEGGG